MSNQWFRFYRGTCEDGKFRMIARNASVTVSNAIALWCLLLDDASHPDHRGVAVLGEDYYASILDVEDGVCEQILGAMEQCKMISVGHGAITITNWNKRQYETDVNDKTNAERQRRYREKRKSNGIVTESERYGNDQIQNTDTDTDTDINTSSNEDVRPSRVKRDAGQTTPVPEFFDEENFETIPPAALVKISPTSDLPLEWGEYAEKLNWGPDQIMAEWTKLVECFSHGSKAGARRSVKGWRKTWAGWIERASRSKL